MKLEAKVIEKCKNSLKQVNKTLDKQDIYNSILIEERLRVIIKDITRALSGKIRGELARDAETVKKQAETLIYELRANYIEKVNSIYNSEIDIPNYLLKNKKRLEKINIAKCIADDEIIKDSMLSLLKELMPKHPKDEYKSTRRMKRHFVIHAGGTNSGKTYNAVQALMKARTGVFLAPLRLLALELFYTINENNVACNLSTGEEDIIIKNNTHVSSTIEKMSLKEEYDVAVIDEAQMIADVQRGDAWTKAILGVKAREVHVCCSPDAVDIIKELIRECNDTVEVKEYERATPLIMESKKFKFPAGVEKGDALVAFSKRSVILYASMLSNAGHKVSVLYGNLPPDTRRRQMDMFKDGETDVLVTTDVIGMGVNLPIRRVIFMETDKYDGQEFIIKWTLDSKEILVNENNRSRGRRDLYPTEVKQIAGRAGRKGIFDEGFVTIVMDTKTKKDVVVNGLNSELKPIKKIYYSPLDEFILTFPIGTLRDRLVAWLQSKENYAYIKKANIDEQLFLLEELDTTFKDELSISNKYKLIFIPFDSKNEVLRERWLSYIRKFLKKEEIEMPTNETDTLDKLETYYRELDLYYAFCKEMNVKFDREAVMEVKNRVSLEIHEKLKSDIKNRTKKCSSCSAELPLSHPYGICESCFHSRRK